MVNHYLYINLIFFTNRTYRVTIVVRSCEKFCSLKLFQKNLDLSLKKKVYLEVLEIIRAFVRTCIIEKKKSHCNKLTQNSLTSCHSKLFKNK